MAVKDDLEYWPRLLELTQCVANEWVAQGLATPCFLGIVPGEVAIADYCSCDSDGCGMAWVRLANITELVDPLAGGSQLRNSNCAVPTVATIEVGHLGCAPGFNPETGELPTVDQQLAASRNQYAAMAALKRAILCCFGSKKDIGSIAYTPLGPSGGCVGGTWNFALVHDG